MRLGKLAVACAIVIGVVAIGIDRERIALNKARYSRARIQVAELQEALRRHYVDNGCYPTTRQGLLALSHYYDLGGDPDDPGMVLPRQPPPQPPLDPWGNPYFYQSDGQSYVLRSFGPAGPENSGVVGSPIVARSPSKRPNQLSPAGPPDGLP